MLCLLSHVLHVTHLYFRFTIHIFILFISWYPRLLSYPIEAGSSHAGRLTAGIRNGRSRRRLSGRGHSHVKTSSDRRGRQNASNAEGLVDETESANQKPISPIKTPDQARDQSAFLSPLRPSYSSSPRQQFPVRFLFEPEYYFNISVNWQLLTPRYVPNRRLLVPFPIVSELVPLLSFSCLNVYIDSVLCDLLSFNWNFGAVTQLIHQKTGCSPNTNYPALLFHLTDACPPGTECLLIDSNLYGVTTLSDKYSGEKLLRNWPVACYCILLSSCLWLDLPLVINV